MLLPPWRDEAPQRSQTTADSRTGGWFADAKPRSHVEVGLLVDDVQVQCLALHLAEIAQSGLDTLGKTRYRRPAG